MEIESGWRIYDATTKGVMYQFTDQRVCKWGSVMMAGSFPPLVKLKNKEFLGSIMDLEQLSMD